jgi:hypothetical protein
VGQLSLIYLLLTVTAIVTDKKTEKAETSQLTEKSGGGERIRTAASQFCRLLPYHLGTPP